LIPDKITATKKFTPNLHVVNSSSFTDGNLRSKFPFQIKPDVTIYSKLAFKTNSAWAEIFIEFKWDSKDNLFCDIKHYGDPLLSNTKSARDTLGQITSYAAAQFGAQFRTHLYSVFICKDTARILRWDRSGAIVTEAFKYNDSSYLVDFFRFYSVASPAMRGVDTSVSIPETEEQCEARNFLKWDDDIPLFKLSVPFAPGSLQYFIVCSPITTAYTPPGRATRGFEAYDQLRKTAVYLKDSWRLNLSDITAEGLVYETLKKASVPNIPHCIASGDISVLSDPQSYHWHATKTQDYARKEWAKPLKAVLTPHLHYRLVLDVIGRSLMEYKSSYEMTAAVRDALVGKSLDWL
jgi:hypothetical protein